MPDTKTVLDLCSGSGAWSKPYKDAGYNVIPVDIEDGLDVCEWKLFLDPNLEVHGILAGPPCTHISCAGSRLFKEKDFDGRTQQAATIVKSCLEIIANYSPVWWALENPKGRMRALVPEIGREVMSFHPYMYGDPYTKTTMLWGRFNRPKRNMVEPYGSISDFVRSPRLRSITPEGFAKAFFEANP